MTEQASSQLHDTLFSGNSGKWASEMLLKAMERGEPFTPSALRTNATLREKEWIHLDDALIEEAAITLAGVADLKAAGLTIPVTNGLGKTVFEYEKVTDMDPAIVSMDGTVRSDNNRVEFLLAALPMPITHKDFFINLRTLSASREKGESLDTTQIRVAGRLISEQSENMLFNGGRTWGGNTIYGYTTHPDRNLDTFEATGGHWGNVGTKTGEQILEDVLSMMAVLQVDRMNGPYWIYTPRDASTVLDDDFKANSDKTTRQRIMEIEGIRAIRTVDQLATQNVVMVQPTLDVVALVESIPLQTIQWDVEGGFLINFKGFQIENPLIRSDAQGRSGVCHMTPA